MNSPKEIIENRIKSIEKSYSEHLEEYGEKYPDIRILVDNYNKFKKENTFSKEFLDGYLATITDLIYIKKLA